MSEYTGDALRQVLRKVAQGVIRDTREIADAETRQLRKVHRTLDMNTRDLRAAERSIGQSLEGVNEWRLPAQPESLLRPDSSRFPLYTPSRAEIELSSRRLVSEHPRSKALTLSPTGEPTMNGVHIWLDDEGRLNVYKPFTEEKYNDFDWLPHEPGALARREVAAYRVINMFSPGRPMVPTTALLKDGPLGPGMIQEFVELKPSKRWYEYQRIDRHTAAIGHHVIGNYDGHRANFRPRSDGKAQHSRMDEMVLFDHGFSFPGKPDHARGSNGFSYNDSVLVQEHYRHPDLHPDVVRNVSTVSPDRIGSAIQDLVSEDAIEYTLRRHHDFIQYKTIQFI
ncbi:hypothetical protein ACFROC_01055 [Nocardia tengchongensis]|uniref:hypothetical protein n=1 Tax=Nocardia tengchongensis TaxID=2055889 RepID=UPI0036C99CB9